MTVDTYTISEGTLLTSDLIAKFLDALRDVDNNEASRLERTWSDILAGSADEQDYGRFHEEASWLVQDLIDALVLAAPAGTYFGAHEGDGALFGFWPIEEES